MKIVGIFIISLGEERYFESQVFAEERKTISTSIELGAKPATETAIINKWSKVDHYESGPKTPNTKKKETGIK